MLDIVKATDWAMQLCPDTDVWKELISLAYRSRNYSEKYVGGGGGKNTSDGLCIKKPVVRATDNLSASAGETENDKRWVLHEGICFAYRQKLTFSARQTYTWSLRAPD